MEEFKYSLMWDTYTKNMCNGLSSLQQRGEFVDMTLAADGHHVKVHKIVLSVVSPYIKDLITSADCPHPVLFLNQVSYETLTSILEYVYTGQVSVSRDKMKSFMEACKALHIKGFEELDQQDHTNLVKMEHIVLDNNISNKSKFRNENMHDYTLTDDEQNEDTEVTENDNFLDYEYEELVEDNSMEKVGISDLLQARKPTVQYSLSNHGNLQLILNRYVYNLRYCARKSGQRTWQCVDGHCKGKKCPARVVTYRDMVLGRTKTHNHPHHDAKILKKVEAGSIFTALYEAENQMKVIRRDKDKVCKF